MMLVNYPTKKELKAAIGTPLKYTETSMFGAEYNANAAGQAVAHRPHLQGGREYFAQIWLKDGILVKVS
jgi:hypothetical protein